MGLGWVLLVETAGEQMNKDSSGGLWGWGTAAGKDTSLYFQGRARASLAGDRTPLWASDALHQCGPKLLSAALLALPSALLAQRHCQRLCVLEQATHSLSHNDFI